MRIASTSNTSMHIISDVYNHQKKHIFYLPITSSLPFICPKFRRHNRD